jgi:type IV pilus assembly protein PilC
VRVLKKLLLLLGVLVVIGGILLLFVVSPGLLPALILSLLYGWMLFAFLSYRHGRQEEFLHVLTTAVEAEAPLAPALWAYLDDRPHGPMRDFWVAVLLFFVVPGYYWIWHRRHSYDHKVARVAEQLEQGVSLHKALQAARGVASREMLLAAAIGESTGRLALCLRNAAPGRITTVWLEILPRFVYPVILLLPISGITTFFVVYILPRFERIFDDFGADLPDLTARLRALAEVVIDFDWAIALTLFILIGLGTVLIVSSTVRWYFPVVARLYRKHVQGLVLRMLAVLLEANQPVPDALALLADSGYFPSVARRRLRVVRRRVEQGEPLADSLRRGRLLPKAMVPLVQAAERMRNLPWALAELGENLAQRTVQLMRRISLVVFPLIVAVIGLLVGFIVIGMFIPLVDLIWRLSS